MSAKLSVEDVLANLERRAAFHAEQEVFHAQQEVHHREQQGVHAAELAKVRQHLEAFRTAAAPALELASLAVVPPPSAPAVEDLPASGRLMVSRLLRRIVASQPDDEPFSATAVAAQVNLRFAAHLKKAIAPRTVGDVLRRLVAERSLHVVRDGKAFHEALYAKGPRPRTQ